MSDGNTNESVFERGPLGADVIEPAEPETVAPAPVQTEDAPVQQAESPVTTSSGVATISQQVQPQEVETADSAEVQVSVSEDDGPVRTMPDSPENMSPEPVETETRTVSVGDEITVRLGANRGRVAKITDIRFPQGQGSEPIFLAELEGSDFWLTRGEFDIGSVAEA